VKISKKIAVIAGLVGVVSIGATATPSKPKKQEGQYVNLKVLPKNISSKDLQGIMTDDFEDGLGVTCGFCHADAKDGHGLDFASDAKAEKKIARKMMQMTIGINKKYFKLQHPVLGSQEIIVTCSTCHHGQPFPDGSGEPK